VKLPNFQTTKKLMTVVHFNRIAMQRKEPEVWTVHNSLGCFNVVAVDIRVPMQTVYKADGPQPRAKFKGRASVEIKDGIAILS
jgi:hypothetical protein